ncbi:MAG TPA: hypothetical protein EYG69_00915 [Campylobacterales bacterium]|nr:hypothetical protein [Campylobacterales bacterium]
MKNIRFIPTLLNCKYEEVLNSNSKLFKDEYNFLSEYETDTVGQWLKNAKARGETSESDQVLLTLLVELHKKIDRLESIIKNEEMEYIHLLEEVKIIGLNFDYIKVEKPSFTPEANYYARIPMPVFPKRDIPVFLTAIDNDTAKISLISQKNLQDWNTYITSKERELIRESKRSNI